MFAVLLKGAFHWHNFSKLNYCKRKLVYLLSDLKEITGKFCLEKKNNKTEYIQQVL